MKIGVPFTSFLTVLVLACGSEPLSSDPGVPASTGGSASGGMGGTGATGGIPGAAATAPADSVTFADGRGVGVMTGNAWVNLGVEDTLTSPVCADDPTTPSRTRQITGDALCPGTGTTVWSNPDHGLCLSGAIPLANSDWENDWGIRVVAGVSDAGGTLGKQYATVSFNYNADGVSPFNPAIRGVVHLRDDPSGADVWYCANIQPGMAVSLTAFNPSCWWPDFPGNLTADQVPSIDQVGIQIPSDNSNDYTLSNFCWSGVAFGGP